MFTAFSILTFIGAALGTLTLLFSFFSSAPQQSILAAIKAQRKPGADDPHA